MDEAGGGAFNLGCGGVGAANPRFAGAEQEPAGPGPEEIALGKGGRSAGAEGEVGGLSLANSDCPAQIICRSPRVALACQHVSTLPGLRNSASPLSISVKRTRVPEQEMVRVRQTATGRGIAFGLEGGRPMKLTMLHRSARLIPIGLAAGTVIALVVWLEPWATKRLQLRVPGTDRPPGAAAADNLSPVLNGRLVQGEGKAADLPGAWTGFRGSQRDGKSVETVSLARSWPNGGPPELWGRDVGEGYAGAAVLNGRVYLMDYDQPKKQDALRCLSLADGKELWRLLYRNSVKRNHGMSRSVPALTEKFVVAMGPKCHVVCVDAVTGELRWGLDLVQDYGSTVPPW